MILHNVGARRSPAGSFAPHIHRTAATFVNRPDSLHIATTLRNQYARGCCIGQSAGECLSHLTDDDVSGWWAYLACMRLEGSQSDTGTDFATVCRAMEQIGTLQYEDDECADDARCLAYLQAGIPPELIEQASATRYRIAAQSVDVHANNAFDAICDFLDATKRPAQFASYVNERFEAMRPGDVATWQHFEDDGSGGGHSMLWCGHKRSEHKLRARTSWGVDFCEQSEFDVDASALGAIWETHLLIGSVQV
jgi:hypothetical protein